MSLNGRTETSSSSEQASGKGVDRMPRDRELSPYQQAMKEAEQKEYSCGILHDSIEEALVHAESNLGFRDNAGRLVVDVKPYIGQTLFSSGTVVGWQSGARKRYRLDFERNFQAVNQAAVKTKNGVNKGTRGVHVNEEDFDRTARPKVCHATTSSLDRAEGYWRRWSSRYGRRGAVTPEQIKMVDG
jgi:hypothetical protein